MNGEVRVAAGDREVQRSPAAGDELPEGEAKTASGRISVAREIRPVRQASPLSAGQLRQLDQTLTRAGRSTGLHFSVYLGDLGEDTHARAEQLHAALDNGVADVGSAEAVLLAVSPGQRVVEVVTGSQARRRLSDRACRLAVRSMVSSFKEGDLAGGVLTGLRMLTDDAGSG